MEHCTKCGKDFLIHDDEKAFLGKLGFTYGSHTFHPAPPTLCPDCRSQLRTAHRNEQYLYKNQSAFSGKDVVSTFAPAEGVAGKAYKIYEQEEWRSDGWDPLEYGRDFDFKRSFFEQFGELQHDVPRMALTSLANENSGFTTGTAYCKNCYLINSSEYCEDCYYGKLFQKCKDSVDCTYLYDSQLCYECFSVYHSYNCRWVAFSKNCRDCVFSSNLQGCSNCCLCTNLNHKEYHFMNQPLAKDEYEKRLKEFLGDAERTAQVKKLWQQQMLKMVHKFANIVDSDACTGDYIEHSQRCTDCYDVNDSQDCRYVCVGVNVKDVVDCSNMYLKPELCYHTLGTIEAYNVAYSLYIFHSQRMLYSEYCFNCSDCFGCSGLTRKKFCVFNKQYTQEEYEKLVPTIITQMQKSGEWGQFFPAKLSPFGYNETLASEYFPLSREEALKQGFYWREKDVRDFKPATAVLPKNIRDLQDSITQEMLACEKKGENPSTGSGRPCGRNYRIIPQELRFYRDQQLPPPRVCPECRHRDRMTLRNPRRLWERQCGKCKKAIQTTYAPERPEIVYCESCYLKEIY